MPVEPKRETVPYKVAKHMTWFFLTSLIFVGLATPTLLFVGLIRLVIKYW